jgi:hypothetical protein
MCLEHVVILFGRPSFDWFEFQSGRHAAVDAVDFRYLYIFVLDYVHCNVYVSDGYVLE